MCRWIAYIGADPVCIADVVSQWNMRRSPQAEADAGLQADRTRLLQIINPEHSLVKQSTVQFPFFSAPWHDDADLVAVDTHFLPKQHLDASLQTCAWWHGR